MSTTEAVDEIYLTSTQVRRRYGGIADMTLWRMLHDANANFPKPITIAKRRLWKTKRPGKFERDLVRQQRRRGF